MGWTSAGWGYWKDANGITVAKTEGGRLVPVDDAHDVQPSVATQAPSLETNLEDFRTSIISKYNPKSFELYLNQTGDIKLSSIIIGKDNQGDGIGTKIMNDLVDFADSTGKRITLTPAQKDSIHGTTSSKRLERFYNRFGFVKNSGRNRDFRINDTMIRNPNIHENRSSGEVWRVDPEDTSVVTYAARLGKRTRYFDNEEKARKFAAGQIKSKIRDAEKKLRKKRPKPPERKQTYRTKND
jgi:GNAT superfamily N-acetyltransferase